MNQKPFLLGLLSIALLTGTFFVTQLYPRGASFQSQELLFSPLKIKELERQATGNVKKENAILAQERVFADQESWHEFWSKYNDDDIPQVDFKTHQVAAVFLGPAGPGHEVRISKVLYHFQKNRTVVFVTELLPNPDKIYPTVIVYPSDIVLFPFKLGDVEFVRTKKVRTD